MQSGIVILGHGSRATVGEANQLLLEVVEQFRQRTGNKNVKPAYMNPKSERPGLMQAVTELIAEGFKEIIVAPLFLTKGLHIRQDIPEILEVLKEKYPQVRITLAEPLGVDARLVEILLDRVRGVS